MGFCDPNCSPIRPHKAGLKLKAELKLRKGVAEKYGAGEGIRTLDPNLGKVVLYP